MEPSWHISGRYFESCNCEAICPCRMIDGVRGGRSTYGICFGALSWQVESGYAGNTRLDGLNAALICRYDDDEPGSPWSIVLHVDGRGDELQRSALADILLGRVGGGLILALPWVRKPSHVIAVRASPVQISHGASGHELRVGTAVTMRASRPVATGEDVRCVIPGYHRPGAELYADELTVRDEPFEWELAGNCAFVSEFAYSSDGEAR
jgi:hypothetical protein